MKLSLFSLPFVGWDNLCLIGWSCSLLNLAAWLSSLRSLRSSSDWSRVIVSSSIISVDFMASVMMRVAGFCTLLTRSKLDLAVVLHAFMPYSSTGLTLPVYSLLRVTVCAPHVAHADFFMRATRTFSFFGLLFPGQPLVKSHPQVGRVVLSKQSLAVDMQGGLLFLC